MTKRSGGTILCLRGGAMGDFLLTLPALRRLRLGLPQARIELVCHAPFGELARDAGLVDEVRRLDHAGLAPFFAPGGTLPQEWVERFQAASVVLSWLFDPLDHFATNLDRIGVRGMLQACWKPEENGDHASAQLGRVLERLALFEEEGEDDQLSIAQPRSERPGLAIHPGSGSIAKNWPLTRWDEFLRSWSAQHPGERVLVLSGEAERERIELLRSSWADLPLDWADCLALPELARRLAGARAWLGHDTGPSHLAATLGVPTLVLFGPTDPAVWAPRGQQVAILRAPEGRLDLLEVKTVIKALEELRA